MWGKPVDLESQLSRLNRILQQPLFRFIIVQCLPEYNTSFEIKASLEKNFPDRPIHDDIKLSKITYPELLEEFEKLTEGFVFLHRFEALIDTPDLYSGFNQRRDRFAEKPIAILAFLPVGVRVLRKTQEHIPDFWSFRTAVFEIKFKYIEGLIPSFFWDFREPPPNSNTYQDKLSAQKSLIGQLEEVPTNSYELRINLLEEIAINYKDLARFSEALECIETGLISFPPSSAAIDKKINLLLTKAAIQIEQFNEKEAQITLNQVDNLLPQLTPFDWETWSTLQKYQADLLLQNRDNKKAYEFLKDKLKEASGNLEATNINLILLKARLGIALMQMGELSEAKSLFESFDSIKEKSLLLSVDARKVACKVISDINSIAVSLIRFELKNTLANSDPYFPFIQLSFVSLFGKGRVGYLKKDEEESGFFEELVSRFEQYYGPEHPLVAEVYFYQAIKDYINLTSVSSFEDPIDSYLFPQKRSLIFKNLKRKEAIIMLSELDEKFFRVARIFEKSYTKNSIKYIISNIYRGYIKFLKGELNDAFLLLHNNYKWFEGKKIEDYTYINALNSICLGKVTEEMNRLQSAIFFTHDGIKKFSSLSLDFKNNFHIMILTILLGEIMKEYEKPAVIRYFKRLFVRIKQQFSPPLYRQ